MKSALLLVPLLLFAAGAQAQVYKCVNAGGQTVYSQTPCPQNSRSTTLERNAPRPAPAPQAKSEKGDAAKGAAAKAPSGPKSLAEEEQEFRKREQEKREEAQKLAKQQEQARDRAENCRNAREQLRNLDSGMRQTRIAPDGERYFLDEAQMAGAKAEAESAVASWCK